MKKYLFSSKTVLALIVAGAFAAVPVASASAAGTNSTTIFATLQGTSVLGQDLPIIGTQGYNVTLPVNSNVVPQVVWNVIDITADVNLSLGTLQIANVYVDPHMAR